MQVSNGKPTEEDVEAKMAQMVCSLNNRESAWRVEAIGAPSGVLETVLPYL